jgi:DnaJ-class molecular chaperone
LSSTRSQRAKQFASEENQDYYALLGVPYSATFQEISRAYRSKMKRSHPDKHHRNGREAAEERAKLLNLAFTTLSKAETRRAYDAQIRATAVQDQIMNRYVGGFAPGGDNTDLFGQALRRQRSKEERADSRRAHRSATTSILIAFGGIAFFIILLLVIWSVASALINTLL